MRVWREFSFEAAHWLPHVPEEHKCRRMHGHSYRTRIEVEGLVGQDGMVIDFAEISAAWKPMHAVLDHHILNEIPGLENPTSENLARWIYHRIDVPVTRVVVMETANTGCEYEA